MIVIPAIDIKGGKVVRLSQGEFSRQTTYSDSPLEMARKWESFGVEMIHIVDLDGALEGKAVNLDIVGRIAKSVRPKIELGGGIRDEGTIKRAIDAGVAKVVIGTKALDQKFLNSVAKVFGKNIVAGIDARDGLVYTKGWVFKTEVTAVELAKRIGSAGIDTINYTDISKDGMLEGPNIDSLRELISATGLNIVAAGGVSSIGDIIKLKALESEGLKGVIVGKALYEGKLDLAEAIKICLRKE
ncbi:MAG: 1-(5-phosphoribosyl)-5-[(5-phosphoribosylamino)methylideneamino]imidazole-4-carboxamide isomerase [Candidatus Omnitrophica bacterium]|nr:1-(5-phosphoribosyl)-5-[(5-phosphoribosylamino)methylideneamino]imidazole-4-carboxamide isomerase [Candidatus Omnitrophota bacterium]